MLANLRHGFAPTVDIDRKNLGEVGLVDAEAAGVEVDRCGQEADRCFHRLGAAFDTLEDPLENAAVLAVARPQEATVFVAAEPVDEEDLRKVLGLPFAPTRSQWPK